MCSSLSVLLSFFLVSRNQKSIITFSSIKIANNFETIITVNFTFILYQPSNIYVITFLLNRINETILCCVYVNFSPTLILLNAVEKSIVYLTMKNFAMVEIILKSYLYYNRNYYFYENANETKQNLANRFDQDPFYENFCGNYEKN